MEKVIKSKLTENKMTMALAEHRLHLSRYEIMLPNVYTARDNEVDLLCVRKSGLCDEFEVKLTRPDFLADKKKYVRYRKPAYGEVKKFSSQSDAGKPYCKAKHQALEDGDMQTNYFWYAVPEGLCEIDEIPDFAGLIVLTEKGALVVKKQPEKLHSEKMSIEDKYKLARKTAYRYWDLKKLAAPKVKKPARRKRRR